MDKYVRFLYFFCLVLTILQIIPQLNYHSALQHREWVTDPPVTKDREGGLGSAWCPSATSCDVVNSGCRPCHRRWLIIISTARSASTTLIHQLWKLPGIHMGGENNNLLGHLHDAFLQTTDHHAYGKPSRPKGGAWVHEPFSKEIMACSVQNAFEAINPPPSKNIAEDDLILGFKTIRLYRNENLNDTVEFLHDSFPCARYLVNYRSPEAIKHSMDRLDFAENKGERPQDNVRPQDDIQNYIELTKQIGHLLPESQTRFLDSGQWTRNITILNEVVRWMGYSDECHFEELLQYNTNGRGYEHSKTDLTIDPNCRYIG